MTPNLKILFSVILLTTSTLGLADGKITTNAPGIPSIIADPLGPYPSQKIAPRTWVVHGPTETPSEKNAGFMNNPGFIVTSNGVVIIDPGSSYNAGKSLLERIRKVTDKPVTHVFASHVHGDHWLGNHAIIEAFPDVQLMAHPEMIREAKAGAAEQWITMLEKLTNNATRGTKAVIPTIALKDGQEIRTGGITFRVILSEHAHTKTDAMILVVEEKVLFTGDNVTYKRIARMDDGSFTGNIEIIERALKLPVTTVVPGHGPSGEKKKTLNAFLTYLKTVYENVAAMVDEGLEDFEMKKAIAPKLKNYANWPGFDKELGKHISLAKLEAEAKMFE